MAGTKSKECTCQKDHGGYWLGICKSTLQNLHINKISFLSNLQFIFCFIFLKDPTSSLSKEEQQKKAWQAQSNKNILVKKTMDAVFPYVSQYFNNFVEISYFDNLKFAYFFKGSNQPIEQRGATEKSLEGSKSKEYTCQKDPGGYWLGICESTFNKNNFLSKFLILITKNLLLFF